MAFKVTIDNYAQYIKRLDVLRDNRKKKWRISWKVDENKRVKKLYAELKKIERDYATKIGKIKTDYYKKWGYHDIDYSDDEHNNLKRVIGRIEKMIEQEAVDVADTLKLDFRYGTGEKYQFIRWYTKQIRETKRPSKARCRQQFDAIKKESRKVYGW